MENEIGLESKIESSPTKKKIGLVDTGANVVYSLIVGGILDYHAGLNLLGIASSRASATAMNTVTGGLYGWWREQICNITRTKKESGRIRKTLSDLLAFNTFQVPVYGTAVAIGSLISDGEINWEKVGNGAYSLATISPLIGPTMGLFTDFCRKLFGIKTAAEGAYKNRQSHL